MDELHIMFFQKLARELGVEKVETFGCKVNKRGGFYMLNSDADVLRFINNLKGGDFVDMYVIHQISTPLIVEDLNEVQIAQLLTPKKDKGKNKEIVAPEVSLEDLDEDEGQGQGNDFSSYHLQTSDESDVDATGINVDEIPSGPVGIDAGFEDINKNKRGRYEGKLGGDDLCFDRSDPGSDISEDEGDPVESNARNSNKFARSYDYAEELKSTNPGTTVVVRTSKNTIPGKEVFQGIYICLEALKSGWMEGCRRIIGFDGTFLKGVCRGELLSCISKDGNNQMELFKEHSKCDILENNMCETFNSWILATRFKSIIIMLEEIRVQVMERMTQMREFSEKWVTDLSPMAMQILSENAEHAAICEVKFNGDNGYDIQDPPYKHVVNLKKKVCSCRSWQLKGIPCAHGITAMHYKDLDVESFIDHWYKKKTYLKACSKFIQPMTNKKIWPKRTRPSIETPEITFMPGRPRKKGQQIVMILVRRRSLERL
ncbi:hypothetical protein H5410_052113 [Solanum commersonii]|uniref:SWIM-type domain-containing protein n=1 Tax=Solanum commersonii TaxID=4109 RepID=A0A9J5X2P5_SOLCO|nr:hypothetical protein H5410_052113 [Solanum commersonii]